VPSPKDFSFELRDDGSVVAAAGDGDEAPPGIRAVTFLLAALADGEAAAHEESANRLSANTSAVPHSFYSSSGGMLSAAAASNTLPVLAAGASLVMIVLSVTCFFLEVNVLRCNPFEATSSPSSSRSPFCFCFFADFCFGGVRSRVYSQDRAHALAPATNATR
jgi:hypothetical protein